MREAELTFVIQGPECFDAGSNRTLELITEIRASFPASPIIFSTWPGIAGRYPETLVIENVDPGSTLVGRGQYTRNLARQQVSTLGGLSAAKTEYSFKLRSDANVVGTKLYARLFHRGASTSPPPWHDRIVLFYHSVPLKLFMIDDKTQLGRTNDLRILWNFDISAVLTEPLLQEIVKIERRRNRVWMLNPCNDQSLAPEQLIFLSQFDTSGMKGISTGGLAAQYLSMWSERFFAVESNAYGIRSHKWEITGRINVWIFTRFLNLRRWRIARGWVLLATCAVEHMARFFKKSVRAPRTGNNL